MTALRHLSDVRTLYRPGEAVVTEDVPDESVRVVVTTARGDTFEASSEGAAWVVGGLPVGTHALAVYSAAGDITAEEFLSVRESAGDDPVMGFVTSFDDASRPSTLAWLRDLRCTVVQVYDWMEDYGAPLATSRHYHDPLGRPIDRVALSTLIAAIRSMGAVAQAYAPVPAASGALAADHPEWRLLRNDGDPESLGDLLHIMDPGNTGWQRHWVAHYGRAADELGFDGFHLDTYGYPRGALRIDGGSARVEDGYASFVRAVRAARPNDVVSFNQVNGVPRGFATPARPGFRYVEVWPPNDRWRHLEGLLARSAGNQPRRGDTLALYPPVWGGDRVEALRTCVLSEAVATMLGASVLLWGDDDGVLRHPYYVDHERLSGPERDEALTWHRFALRHRDLFTFGLDTSWYELSDENAAVTVTGNVPSSPEPVGESLFVRVRRDDDLITVAVLDLTGSVEGSWATGTRAGQCATADITALVAPVDHWRSEIATLGRNGGRFTAAEPVATSMREGVGLRWTVPLGRGWAILRLDRVRS